MTCEPTWWELTRDALALAGTVWISADLYLKTRRHRALTAARRRNQQRRP